MIQKQESEIHSNTVLLLIYNYKAGCDFFVVKEKKLILLDWMS